MNHRTRPVMRTDLSSIEYSINEIERIKNAVAPAPLKGEKRTEEQMELFHQFNAALDRLRVLESRLESLYA